MTKSKGKTGLIDVKELLERDEDFLQAAQLGRADGLSMADTLHYNRLQLGDIRAAALKAGLAVRQV